jgi:predicted GNAT family acetyltransferase
MEAFNIVHENGRFSLARGEVACELLYEVHDGVASFTHTRVPQALRGQGLAAHLVEAGLQWAVQHKLRIRPDCSYVQSYIERHPQWREWVA